jgi:hypothetical protein
MSGRSAFTRAPRTSGDWDSSSARAPERQRRSLSQDTHRQLLPISSHTPDAATASTSATSPHSNTNADTNQHLPKRLGFLGDMLSNSSTAAATRNQQSNQIPPGRSHSRADSANLLRETTASPAPTITAKAHPSPSKVRQQPLIAVNREHPCSEKQNPCWL